MNVINLTLRVLALCTLVAVGGGSISPAVVALGAGGGNRGAPDKVSVQLKWATQVQFAGFDEALIARVAKLPAPKH